MTKSDVWMGMRDTLELKKAILLSTGFWSTYFYSHWIGAQAYLIVFPAPYLNYYSFVALALVLLGLLFVLTSGIHDNVLPALDILAAVCMSIAVLMVHAASSDAPTFCIAAFGLAGFSSSWLLIRWGTKYAQAPISTAFLALIIGALIVSILKISMALLPELVSMIFVICMLAVSVILLGYLTSRRPASNEPSNGYPPQKVDASFWLAGCAIFLFLFIWAYINTVSKIGTGNYGYGPSSSPWLVGIAQMIDVAFMLIMYWWYFERRERIEYSQLWRIAFVCLALALLIISYRGTVQLVQVFTSAAFEIAIMLLWLLITVYTHHTTISSFAVFAFGQLLHIVPQWLVKTIVASEGITIITEQVVSLFLFLIVAAIVILLPHRSPDMQLLFSGLNPQVTQKNEETSIEKRCDELAEQFDLTDRETEIIRYLSYGRTKQYIAETLCLSENTIRTYTQRAYMKIGIHSRQELQSLTWEDDSSTAKID